MEQPRPDLPHPARAPVSTRTTLVVGVLFGSLFLAHLLIDRGRGTAAQFVWPLLAGVVTVLLPGRTAPASVARGAALAGRAGAAATLVLVVVGTPLLYFTLPSEPPPGVPLAGHPAALLVLVAVSTVVIGLLFTGTAVLGAAVTTLALGRAGAPEPSATNAPRDRSFLRAFAVLFAAGFVGVLSLVPVLPDLLRQHPPPGPPLPLPALVALSLVNPTLMLATAVAAGLALAPRLGLRSYLAERARTGTASWRHLGAELPLALGLGVAVSALVVLLDLGFEKRLGMVVPEPGSGAGWNPLETLSGILYGGITEELMMRWGALSVAAWLCGRIAGRGGSAPGAGAMWTATVVSALLFGAGHLPVLAAVAAPTPLLVVRTVLLNAFAGVVFGWLYWRRSLEAAMAAHAVGHLVFAASALLGGT